MPRKKQSTLIIIVIAILLVVILHYIRVLRPVEEAIRGIINPLSRTTYHWSTQIGNEYVSFSSIDKLEDAYTSLRNEFDSIEYDAVTLALLQKENVELREQLSYMAETQYDSMGANVIGKNIDPIGNSIIINRGELDGMKEGFPVIVGKGYLIGKIAQVHKSSSVVRLLNDNQSKVAATVLSKDTSIGIVEGGFGLSVRMNNIPQNELVEIDNTVITSGLEKTVPKGLIIGQISSVEKEPYQPFQRAIILPAAEYSDVTTVSVLIEKGV